MIRISDNMDKKGRRKKSHTPGTVQAKAEIRERVVAEMGGPEQVRVFDAFAGEGEMWNRVWHNCARYVGCDKTWHRDERLVYVADNLRVIRAIDLQQFNVFDFDAWGGPWTLCLILANRRPLSDGERLGLVLTDGGTINIHLGNVPAALAQLNHIKQRAMGLARYQDELINTGMARVAELMGGVITKRWEARAKTTTHTTYTSLIIEREPRMRHAGTKKALGPGPQG